jgi:hypothetical protein
MFLSPSTSLPHFKANNEVMGLVCVVSLANEVVLLGKLGRNEVCRI